jgi:hypothetical protein
MADEFPLPGSSYKELIKIIQGYGKFGKEASLGDISQLTAIGETVVSANNKFLVATGVIKGGKKKGITPIGGELANALEHNMVDDISQKWRALISNTDFLQKVVAAVRIRKGMDESSLESHVAYSAGQPKTSWVATGARTVVDILKTAGALKEEGGNLVATSPEPPTIPQTVQQSLSISDSSPLSENVEAAAARSTQTAGVQINIEVSVRCAPADLDELGKKLRKLIEDFKTDPKSEKQAEAPGPPNPVISSSSAEGAQGE